MPTETNRTVTREHTHRITESTKRVPVPGCLTCRGIKRGPSAGPRLDTPEPVQILRLEISPDDAQDPQGLSVWSGVVLGYRDPEFVDRYVVWSVWSEDAREFVCHSGFYTEDRSEALRKYEVRRRTL